MLLAIILVSSMASCLCVKNPHIHSDAICLEAAKNVTFEPLCASNGQTFQNYLAYQCYQRYFNAQGLSARQGACAAHPEPNHCPFSFVVWRRVCGEDNVTYSSIWEMLCEAQRRRKLIRMAYQGPCRIRCPMSLKFEPVCGSDNKDYPNPEALKCAALSDTSIKIAKMGTCSTAKVSHCREMGRRNDKWEKPVCGSNGITYFSHSAIMCLREHNPDLQILHDGPCKLEDVNLNINPTIICQFADNQALWLPVCASNGITYPNPFVFQCAIEREEIQRDVEVNHAGECSKGSDPGGKGDPEDACREASMIPPVIDKPLFCASDGKTYYNTKQYACAVQKDGDWFNYNIVSLNVPCDASDTPCERLRLVPEALTSDPICGSDGVSYANPLALLCAIAADNTLKRHHKGQCLPKNAENGHNHNGDGSHGGGDNGDGGGNNGDGGGNNGDGGGNNGEGGGNNGDGGGQDGDGGGQDGGGGGQDGGGGGQDEGGGGQDGGGGGQDGGGGGQDGGGGGQDGGGGGQDGGGGGEDGGGGGQNGGGGGQDTEGGGGEVLERR